MPPSPDGIDIYWALPVTLAEIAFINEFGGDKFEDLLSETAEDIVDFDRAGQK